MNPGSQIRHAVMKGRWLWDVFLTRVAIDLAWYHENGDTLTLLWECRGNGAIVLSRYSGFKHSMKRNRSTDFFSWCQLKAHKNNIVDDISMRGLPSIMYVCYLKPNDSSQSNNTWIRCVHYRETTLPISCVCYQVLSSDIRLIVFKRYNLSYPAGGSPCDIAQLRHIWFQVMAQGL